MFLLHSVNFFALFQTDSNTLRPKELAMAQKGSFLIIMIIMIMCQVLFDG